MSKKGNCPYCSSDNCTLGYSDFQFSNTLLIKLKDKPNMNFGQAIEALKEGKMVSRSGWNGKLMFIFQRPADELSEQFIIEKVKSLPQSLKDYYKSNPISSNNEGSVRFTAYLCMKAADGTIVNGWLASQTDMLAEDWDIVEY